MSERCGAAIEKEWKGHRVVLSRRYCRAWPAKGFRHCRYHLTSDEWVLYHGRYHEESEPPEVAAETKAPSASPGGTTPGSDGSLSSPSAAVHEPGEEGDCICGGGTAVGWAHDQDCPRNALARVPVEEET